MTAGGEGEEERRPLLGSVFDRIPEGLTETASERRERLLSDTRLVALRVAGTLIGLSYQRMRELRMYRARAERVLVNPEADEQERAEAATYLASAFPDPVSDAEHLGAGQVWKRGEIYRWACATGRVDPVWYEPQRPASPGRKPGGSPAVRYHRRGFTEELARLGTVPVSADRRTEVQAALDRTIAGLTAQGRRTTEARDLAVRSVALECDVDERVVRKVLLLGLVESR
ncbi:hypothetical protein [Paractinoplanes maris]|uniref:hypothetical protein n=1 Tax=Paractinoplanes maris TaxID=1734446 RepID=UPI002020CE25|nr:hypothetical protein [Actinoplanes maris]